MIEDAAGKKLMQWFTGTSNIYFPKQYVRHPFQAINCD